MCAAASVFLNKRFLVRVFGFGNIEVSMPGTKATQRSGSKLGRQVSDNHPHCVQSQAFIILKPSIRTGLFSVDLVA